MQCLNLELIANLNRSTGLLGLSGDIINEKDEEILSDIYHAKFRKDDKKIVRLKNKALSDYDLLGCDKKTRNINIIKAVFDGYKQSELAEYLGVSNVLISKLMKHHRVKEGLFEKLKSRGLFWMYAKNISYQQLGDYVLCETLLKYAKFDDLKVALDIFGRNFMKQVWLDKLVDDKRLIRLNLFLARVMFSMDVESSYFKEVKSGRGEKLRLLAS